MRCRPASCLGAAGDFAENSSTAPFGAWLLRKEPRVSVNDAGQVKQAGGAFLRLAHAFAGISASLRRIHLPV